MDKTPPTLTGFPADTDVVCRAQPPFVPKYSDELSGVDTASLHVQLDSSDVSAGFERFDRGALFIPTNALAGGSHAWVITVSDLAGNTVEAGASFSISSAGDCPSTSDLNVGSVVTMPDVEAVWVQDRRDDTNTAVNFEANFGEEQPFNARWDQFGMLVPLDFGTNVVLLTGEKGGKVYPEAVKVIRSDRHRAKLHAPTSGDFVMSEPAMGYFANGQPQTASGTVSATLDAGTPEEAVLLSVSVNGVACTITGPDANGNMTFTGQNPCSVSTNFTSTTVTVCYTNSTTNVCHTIPLGVWEGYFVQQRRAEIENRSFVLMFQRFPGNLCNGIYDWFVPNFPPIIRTDIRFSLAASGGVECTTNQLGNARTSDSSHCADAPDFDALVYEYNVPPNGSCEQRSQPTSRGLTFGYSKEHEFRSNDYNNDAVFDDELVSAVSFYWPSGETNEIVFTAPIYYGTNTPVIFTFEGVNYATTNALDLSQVTYDGNTPVTWSNEIGQVGYLLTVNGGNYYTNNRAKFSWPAGYTATSTTNTCQNCPPSYFGTASTYTISDKNWLSFTGYHNGQIGGGECVLNPRWHHMLPQAFESFFNQISDPATGAGVNIHEGKFGLVLDMDEHTFLHNIPSANNRSWNNQWKQWRQHYLNLGITPTYNELDTQLTKLKGDKKFKPYIKKGKLAAHTYQQWGAHGQGVQDFIRAWGLEKHNTILARVPSKCRLGGKIVKTGSNKVTGFVFVVVDVKHASNKDEIIKALFRNEPVVGTWVDLGEEIGDAIGTEGIWFNLITFWNLLMPKSEEEHYRKQMRENVLDLLDNNPNLSWGHTIVPQ